MSGNCTGTINVTTIANIVSTSFTVSSNSATTIQFNGNWQNTGGTATFTPSITVDGVATSLGVGVQTVAAGATYNTGTLTISAISGTHTVCPVPNPTSIACGTVTVGTSYVEASLVSCQWPSSPVAGQAAQMTVNVNGGSVTEPYKLSFTGAITATSNSFTVNANTTGQSFTVTITFPTAGSSQSVIASLVKA